MLLIGAGLTLRSFAKLIAVDPGFSVDGVVTLQAALAPGRYTDQPARSAAYQRLFAALDALPQVDTVSAAAVTPLTGNNWTAPLVRPEHPLPAGQRPPEVGWQSASGEYFRALRIPLRTGRLFDARDSGGAPPVVIVSDALAERHFLGEDPVGKRIELESGTAEIVGRVGDIRRASLSDAPRADLYFPFERQNGNGIILFLRAKGDPLAALPAIRTAIRPTEPDTLVFKVRTLADIAAASAATSRLAMGRIYRDRVAARGSRDLRRDVVQPAAALAPVRHAARARREPARHHRPRHAAGHRDCRHRSWRRTRRRPSRRARWRRCSTTCRPGIRWPSASPAWC